MRQSIGSALVKITACRLFGAKPLSELNAHARQETARIQIALRNLAIYRGITRHRAIRTSNRLYEGIVKPQMLMTNCFIVFYMNFYMDFILCSETN